MIEWMENRWDRKRPERKTSAELQKSTACPLLPPSVILRAFEVDRRPVFTPVFRLRADQPPSLWTGHKAPGVPATGEWLPV